MVNPQGTSFIPQRPAHGKNAPGKVRRIYVLAYLSYILFFGSLLSAGGVFFLNFTLDAQLLRQQEALTAEKSKFNEADILSVRDLERRINTAQQRLDSHISVLAVLEALEQTAVASLRYTDFTYTREGDAAPTVTFIGDSNEFNNILFQRDVIANNPILAGSAFKEVGVKTIERENGPSVRAVTFQLEKVVDASLIGYTPRTLHQIDDQVQNQDQNQQQQIQQEGSDGGSAEGSDVNTQEVTQ